MSKLKKGPESTPKPIPKWISYLFYFILLIIVVNLLLPDDKKSEDIEVPIAENSPKIQDYSVFDYPLTGSDYVYKVKIEAIETKVAKAAFTTQKDDYSVPQPVDGYYLKIRFALTNPYDQEMMVPIPHYFYISSTDNEFFTASTVFNRSCECKIDNGTKVLDENGKEPWQFSQDKCGADYCVKFKPKETKKYTVKFTDPVFGEVRKLWFWGFDRHWVKEGTYRDRDWVLTIDTDKKEVIGDAKL